MDLIGMIIQSKRRCERGGPLNQSWSGFRGTKMNTSRSLGVDQPDTCKWEIMSLELPVFQPAAVREDSRVLEIQLIDERSLVRQTETGMWEEALDAESRDRKTKKTTKKKKKRRKRRRRGGNARPLSLARSLARSSLLVARSSAHYVRPNSVVSGSWEPREAS